MNREQIFEKLESLNLNKERYIIISGASLVVQGIVDYTPDIDLATDIEYYNIIDWPKKKGAFNHYIKYKDVFEISYNLFDKENIVLINGYKFANLEHILKIKKDLNREKDLEIIKKLEELL